MGELISCRRLLAFAGLAAQLSRDLNDLSYTGGSDGVAHTQEPAGRADCNSAADIEFTVAQAAGSLSVCADTHRLDILKFLDRECIVQFDNGEIVGADAGLSERPRRGACSPFIAV